MKKFLITGTTNMLQLTLFKSYQCYAKMQILIKVIVTKFHKLIFPYMKL